LRQNLSFFLDKAKQEPVAINRGQDRYVLMSEGELLKLKEEIFNLQKSLISSLQIQNGEGEKLDLDDKQDSLLNEYIEIYEKAKKNSKAG
jgi:PHD/YefM family antitoxin component YafN of YafNO toxin-antitoxin module